MNFYSLSNNKKNHDLKFTGERVVEGLTPIRIWLDHIARYEFASDYVKKKKVLDIACGTGYGSKILCDAGAERVIGIDVSRDIVNFALNKYEVNGLEFQVGNILNINFIENYFDVIICFETIEHIHNQEKALAELQRVLNPNGLIIISSPNRKLTSPFKFIDEQPDNKYHCIEYTEKEFIQLLENYFKILEIYGQRAISKLLLFHFLEKVLRRVLPNLYNPSRGRSEVEKVSFSKEYRYIIAVCKKRLQVAKS
jgi:ubiquinone/menaquinone biosynthesis C-methylase UbiE